MQRVRGDLTQLSGISGSLTLHHLRSEALASNALGDPARRLYAVYTPPGYDRDGSVRYRTLYALHGHGGSLGRVLSLAPWERNVVQLADEAIQRGEMSAAILILVDGSTRLGGAQYVDSLQNGAFARYVTQEIVDAVDAQYRTIAQEGGRALLGKSSGGFGALHIAMTRPGRFCAVASLSGDAYFRLTIPALFAPAQRAFERTGGDLLRFLSEFESDSRRRAEDFEAAIVLAYAGAYSARSAAFLDVDLPFDAKTGEIDDGVFSAWCAFDPYEAAPLRGEELRRLRLCYLDSGRRDEYALDIAARVLARRLVGLGVAVRCEEFPGGHRNTTHRFIPAFQALLEVLDC